MPARTAEAIKNPDKKPLGELSFQVVDDGKRTVPALDAYWAPRNFFSNYVGILSSTGSLKAGSELKDWHHDAQCFQQDMDFLLSRRHHEFWSYMVYKKTALAAVVSFLQNATPFYIDMTSQTKDAEIIKLYEDILNLVLRIICRLVTNKESAEFWITKEHLRELIYKNYLISVPMLFDLLIAVGNADAQNATVLQHVFASLLKIEPNYRQDILAGLAFFKVAFRSIHTQTENEGVEGAGGGALDENAETPYDDVVLYTLDCAFSLSVLLDVCPDVRMLCGEINLAQTIANFYDSTIPFLYKNIFLISESASSLSVLNQARLQFLKAFRSIAYGYIEQVLDNPEDSLVPSESFVGLLTECLSEQTFVVDYEREYPVRLDVDILKQACKDLDEFKAKFVMQGYRKEAESTSFGTIGNVALTMQANSNIDGNLNVPSKPPSQATTAPEKSKSKPSDAIERDLDVEVTAILEVFPTLGTGFIRRVISRYENREDAIAAILEGNLPPDLQFVDHSEPYIPPDPQDKLQRETNVRHYNVYDGDQYDVMTQDKPNCIIKQGKGLPHKAKNAQELLDDKSDLAAIKHRYQEYSLVTEDDDYEDEYDDSYEAVLESETRVIRSKAFKAGLANIEDVSDDESEEEEQAPQSSQKPDTNHRDKPHDFCENPEVIRARYEANRQAKFAKKNKPDNKPRDVVGAPKGQGQDKDTLFNRNKKEKTKGTRANHNRKAGAAFKRSKGMLS